MSAEVRLQALATSVPQHRFAQDDARRQAALLFNGAFPDLARRLAVFDHSGIDWRHACLPLDRQLELRSFSERNSLFVEHAVTLLAAAAQQALQAAGLGAADVDAVVCVSSTGIATPSLDAHVADRLGLRSDVERTPLFGLGCVGGVLGLARAASLARSRPGSRVLLLAVELCTLTLRLGDLSMTNLLACALFGDGAAAAVIGVGGTGPRLSASAEHRWSGTLNIAGWRVEDDGLAVLLGPEVQHFSRHELRAPVLHFLERAGASIDDVDAHACHPGGGRILDCLQQALGVPRAALDQSRDVLRTHGNMSSVTALFVLARHLGRGGWRRALMSALGPGFTAGFLLLENDR